MIRRHDDGTLVAASEKHCSRVGVIHARCPTNHECEHFGRYGILYAHTFDKGGQGAETSRFILQKVSRFGDSRRGDVNSRVINAAEAHLGPLMVWIPHVERGYHRTRIKYYDRR